MSIQDNQMEPWKELLMLEQRILSKFLPENFDQLQTFVGVDCYTPSINNDCAVRYRLKKLKILQESKRSWLDIHLRAYVLKIEAQDRYYQSALVQLEQSMNASVNRGETSLFQALQLYMTQRCHRLKEAAYLQMNSFRARLTRRRQLSFKSKHMVGVSSQVMLDVDPRHHTLNALECEYLSRGKLRLLS